MCTEVVLWSTFALQSKTFQQNVGESTTSAYFKLVLNLKLCAHKFLLPVRPSAPELDSYSKSESSREKSKHFYKKSAV